MKKLFTAAALTAFATCAFAQDDVTYDFVPSTDAIYFQTVYDNNVDDFVPQTRIDFTFDEDFWWVSGFSAQCYILDPAGEVYTDWTPDFGGLSSDYTKGFFGMNGISQYEDVNYTLVVPQGLLGNTAWAYGGDNKRSNPELRYEFNTWELAGRPREDKTVYDFSPVAYETELVETRINGTKQLELQLRLTFEDAVAIYENVENKWSVFDTEGNYLQDSTLRAFVSEENPNMVVVGLRGINFKTDANYTISIWMGAFGDLEWAAEDYCEGHSNPPLEYVVNPLNTTSGVEGIEAVSAPEAPIYNINGMQVNPDNLDKGIYIRNGQKFIVK